MTSDKDLREARIRLRGSEEQDLDDMQLVVDADLATHPPDDDEPVMGEWLGNVLQDRHLLHAILVDQKVELLVRMSYGVRSMWHYETQTRGDVRRLCEDLGVELKE